MAGKLKVSLNLWIAAFAFCFLAAVPGAFGEETPGDNDAQQILKMFKGITFFGDLRIRYEGIFDDTAIANNRGRFRFRAGFTKSFGKIASLTFQGISGATVDPTSPNQTFTSNFGPKTFHIAHAFGTLQANPWLELRGGKMPVPFEKTDLIWDGDLNPEGLAESIQQPYSRGKMFMNFGQFIFNNSATTEDGYILGFQAGMTHQASKRTQITIAPAFTQFIRPDATLAAGLNGNLTNTAGTALLSDFRVWNLYARIQTSLRNGTPLQIDIDAAHNSAAKAFSGKVYDDAYYLQLGLGRSKSRGDWMAKYRIARVEPDAVISAFNDSDFSFSDTKGHRMEVSYIPLDFMKLSATGFFLKSVRPNSRPDRARLQVDATLSF